MSLEHKEEEASSSSSSPSPWAKISGVSSSVSSVDLAGMVVEIEDHYEDDDGDDFRDDVSLMSSVNSFSDILASKHNIPKSEALNAIANYLKGGKYNSLSKEQKNLVDSLISGGETTSQVEAVDISKSPYKKQYEEVFKNYSIGKFRAHLREKHPDLSREPPPDKKNEKIQKIVAESNAIIKAFGFLIGFKRLKAKSNKKTDYNKAWEEREDLRELVFGRIMIPMLITPTKKVSGQDILKQDLKAVEGQYTDSNIGDIGGNGGGNNFRIGAVIDVEKLGINTELLRQVLTGQTRSMGKDILEKPPGIEEGDVGKEGEGSGRPPQAEGETDTAYQERLEKWRTDVRMAHQRGGDTGTTEGGHRRRLPYSDTSSSLLPTVSSGDVAGYSDAPSSVFILFDQAMGGGLLIEGTNAMDDINENADAMTKAQITQIKDNPDLSPIQKLDELENLILSLQQRHNDQVYAVGGANSPVAKQLRADVTSVKTYRNLLTRYYNLILPSIPSQKPGVSQGSMIPGSDSQDPHNVPTESATSLKKKDKETWAPSRRRVIQRAKQLVLKSVRPQKASKLNDPYSRPENVNYYAPNVRHRYKGGLRVIQ